MEENFDSIIYSLSNSRCQNNHPIQLFCKNPKCMHPASICKSQLCTQNLHKQCSFIYSYHLIQKLQAKKSIVSPQVQIIWNTLDDIYTQAIQKLSKDRDSIKAWYDSFGLNACQHRLIQCIDFSYMSDISGKLINQIIETQKFGDKKHWPNPEKVKKSWAKLKKQFYRTFDEIAQGCLDYQISIDQLCQKSKLQKQILKLEKISEQKNWQPFLNLKILRKDFTEMTYLNLCQQKIDVIQGLQCLINLKRLRLSDNNIKKIQNLDNLKNLEMLDLNHNKIQKIEHLNGLKQCLRQLYLCDNLIKKLENLRQLNKLRTVYLRGNPFIQNSTIIQKEGQRDALAKKGITVSLSVYIFLC